MTTPPEKAPYEAGATPYHEPTTAGEYDEKLAPQGTEERRQSVADAEAVDVYGNAAEAEQLGYVERG
jgi:hypothetical protein